MASNAASDGAKKKPTLVRFIITASNTQAQAASIQVSATVTLPRESIALRLSLPLDDSVLSIREDCANCCEPIDHLPKPRQPFELSLDFKSESRPARRHYAYDVTLKAFSDADRGSHLYLKERIVKPRSLVTFSNRHFCRRASARREDAAVRCANGFHVTCAISRQRVTT